MNSSPSHMAREIAEIPAAAARLRAADARAASAEAAAALRALDPRVVLTVARGSSDHAATWIKYAVELALGLPVASVGPSVITVYGARPRVAGAAALAISQSGGSADLLALSEALLAGGADLTVLTNTPDSPLGRLGQRVIDIKAGPERAVAATKSFVTSIVAGLGLVADWAGDDRLQAALDALPEALERALEAECADLLAALDGSARLTVIARGPALGLAFEAGLKVREVLGRAADGYSAAEVLHGPSTLLGPGQPVLILGGAGDPGTAAAAEKLAGQGARPVHLPVPADGTEAHALTRGLPQIALFYRHLERVAVAQGMDPDNPPFLKKKTVTL